MTTNCVLQALDTSKRRFHHECHHATAAGYLPNQEEVERESFNLKSTAQRLVAQRETSRTVHFQRRCDLRNGIFDSWKSRAMPDQCSAAKLWRKAVHILSNLFTSTQLGLGFMVSRRNPQNRFFLREIHANIFFGGTHTDPDKPYIQSKICKKSS